MVLEFAAAYGLPLDWNEFDSILLILCSLMIAITMIATEESVASYCCGA